jgi:predicted esterase
MLEMVMCGDTPPPGAELAPALPTYGGICPTIETGIDNLNVIPGKTSIFGIEQDVSREFIVVVPEDLSDDEVLPVIFMWHWLGGDATGFYERSEVQEATNHYRFMAIIPNGRAIEQGVAFKWPFAIIDGMELMNQDVLFFEDMLACAAEQFSVDKECVSSTGVSAGGLFTGQLAGARGERLSSIISLSGGVGGATVKPWKPSPHKMPAMVLWGGPDDFCIAVDFNVTSMTLEEKLDADNHFVVECVHNCTHATPPFQPPDNLPTYAAMWRFFLDHPYWLGDGESWYDTYGLPDFYPEWCAVGTGNAEIRVGECGGSEC